MNNIQLAQVEAGERAVVERLQRKGLMAVPRTAIVINLDDLDRLAKDYITEMGGDGENDITERLTLSSFIQWLRNQQKSTDDEINQRR